MGSYRQKITALFIAALMLGTMLSGCGDSGTELESESGTITTQQSETADESGVNRESSVGETLNTDKTDTVSDASGETSQEETDSQEITIEVESDSDASDTETQEDSTADIPKDVDLIFFMGQSNMSGCGGDYTQAPSIIPGAGYEFRAVSDPYNLHEIKEPFGYSESVVGGIWDAAGAKKGSLVTSFVNRYYEKTGRCVIAVSASAGGTTTENWLSTNFVTDLSLRVKNAQDYLNNNGYTVKNQYVVWLQGESDALNKTTKDEYKSNMDTIIRPLFVAGFTKVFVITPGQINTNAHFFDNIIECQIDMCKHSGYYALATTALSAVPVSYMVDEWHYNQKVLNLIGEEAADSAAYYTNEGKEMCIYDYKNDTTYIPDFFDYDENVTAEKKDISGILAQQ